MAGNDVTGFLSVNGQMPRGHDGFCSEAPREHRAQVFLTLSSVTVGMGHRNNLQGSPLPILT